MRLPASDDETAIPAPNETSRLFGHEAAERALLNAYRSGRLHHAWLIGGPPGIGKATLAWRFARFLLAWPDPKRREVQDATDLSVPPGTDVAKRILAGSHGDAAVLRREWNDKTKRLFSDIRVDDVRKALGLFQQASGSGGYRICIVDTAEDLNRSSANALLKIVEEPPPRSLFLLLAHRPGPVMPTLVSRCRRLMLTPLPPDQVVAAVRSLGPDWSGLDEGALRAAAARSHGSVAAALEAMGGERLELSTLLQSALARLPQLDWRALHRVADRIGSSNEDFAFVCGAILDWLSAAMHRDAEAAVRAPRLARYAEIWDRTRAAAAEAEVLNLDKRPVLLSFFADIATLADAG